MSADSQGVSDDITQIFVRWRSPKIFPLLYRIEAHSDDCKPVRKPVANKHSSYLFENLNGGTKYRFKVIAIHPDEKNYECWSNEKETSPSNVKFLSVCIFLSSCKFW